ncbi:hypothetical protein DU490_06980 [Halomonas sp. DQ26W]|nr:hypothetical protein DU490_06980 [Halomonas sp. DQ26W]
MMLPPVDIGCSPAQHRPEGIGVKLSVGLDMLVFVTTCLKRLFGLRLMSQWGCKMPDELLWSKVYGQDVTAGVGQALLMVQAEGLPRIE